MRKKARADVNPIRQRTQFTCVATSTCMALQALGVKCDEETVNEIIGAQALKGSRWEEVLACCQYFGCRATLTTPATLSQVKEWTDSGRPVLIAWNPEGRDWSHASLIYDVTGEKGSYEVHVADPNIPNPDKTVRVVGEDDFYSKWFEKWPNFLVRRPALMIDREITPQGRQVMASLGTTFPQAVREIVSNIRHLGFLIVENQWSTTDENPTYKISVPGIEDYTLEFERSPTPSVRLIEGRRVVRTIREISKFPEIIRHLPKQTSRMASVLPCIQSQTTVGDEEARLALESLPMGLSRREKAIMLANLLDGHAINGRFSMIDLALRDLDNMSRLAGRKEVVREASIKKVIPLQFIKKMEMKMRESFPDLLVSVSPTELPDSPVQFRFEVESSTKFSSAEERKFSVVRKFFENSVNKFKKVQERSLSEGTYKITVGNTQKDRYGSDHYLFFNISLTPHPSSISTTKQILELDVR